MEMEVVTMDVPTGSTASQFAVSAEKRQANDEPQTVSAQSWKNIYVDVTRQPIHIALDDAYYGKGGFAGDIPSTDTDTSDGTYTYLVPTGSEMLYRWRVKQTWLHNYYARFINSQVFPVFSIGTINLTSRKGKELYDDKELKAWLKNCTGTGTTYEEMQKYSMIELRVHDVAYYTMTKTKKNKTALGVYRAIDVIYTGSDEDGILTDIAFFKGTRLEGQKIITRALRVFMSPDGFCYLQNMEAEGAPSMGSFHKWDDFKPAKWNGSPRDTGIEEMVAHAHIPVAKPEGEWVPTTTRSKSVFDCCMNIYNDDSSSEWLFKLTNQPIPYAYTKSSGMKIGIGNMILIEPSAVGENPPAPDYMSVDSAALQASNSYLMRKIESLREIAKENGVDSKTGAQAQSGESKRYEFQATESKLKETVSYCRDMNGWVFRLYNLLNSRNDDVYSYELSYPESFYPEEEPTFAEYEALETRASDIGANVLANIVMRKWSERLLGKSATEDEQQAITKELENLQRMSSTLE